MFNFFNRKRIVCPRCLESIPVKKDAGACPRCHYPIPIGYLQNYEYAPPIFIQVFGWTAHGKTMFLDVLRLILLDMSAVWSAYIHEPLTRLDLEHQRALRTDRQQGNPPGSTPKKDRDQNEVYIMLLKNMERWQSRMLVVMDHAGERFETFDQVPVQEIPYLLNTPTTIMLISLPDMEREGRGESMDQLLHIYLETMRKNNVDFKKMYRKLVIVFTKADLIKDLPANLRYYLMDDDTWQFVTYPTQALPLNPQSLAEYLERMGRVSDEIRNWIQTLVGGTNLVRLIESYNIDARYSLISATGQDLEISGGANIVPRRVLDPFFWALEFQSQ